MSIKRRQFTQEFKIQVLREVEAGKGIAQTAREHQLHPTLIGKWRKQRDTYPETAFAGNGNAPIPRKPRLLSWSDSSVN